MVAPNLQAVVNGKLIVVELIPGQVAMVAIGSAGNARTAGSVSVKELLDAGLSEHQALQRVLDIASFVVQSATV